MAKCDNPMCSCDPCGCGVCTCGNAKLGDLERRVMGILWGNSARELSGRNVADELPELAYTTIATVLDRLVHKGLVHRRMDGRKIKFCAVGSQGAHSAILMREVMESGTDAESALVSFARTLSCREVAVLRAALDAEARDAVTTTA